LAVDSLSEPLYQRLMIANLSVGQHAEAMQVFRRCRETLSIVLGIPPSSETQALFKDAQNLSRLAQP
jgi:DNA-binding SARP family transcriptional activator